MISQIDLDRELVRRYGLLAFGYLAWHLVEPSVKYVHNRYVEEICKHVEGVYFGSTPQCLINVPPGTGKSLWCSVFADAWAWTKDPGLCIISASYDDGLSQRDSLKVLAILTSDWYKERWPAVQVVKNAPKVKDFQNTAGGFRFATSIEGRLTGRHAHVRKFDDPIKPLDTMGAASATQVQLDKVITWWTGTMSTRVREPDQARYLGIMQRLHERDLTGYLLEVDKPAHLRLPMRYEASNPCVTPIGGDWRTQDGELLCPNRYSEYAVGKLEATLGVHARAQLQQDPVDPEGSVFKASTFKRWYVLPTFTTLVLSGDMTFKKAAGSDKVALQVWGCTGTDFYLVDQAHGLMSFEETVRTILQLLRKWPDIGAKLIEDTANGPAVIETLSRATSGVVAVKPEGGKIARANAVGHLFAAGNVYFPHDGHASWVPGFIAEVLGFPRAKHDDQVDAMTQALAYMARNTGSIWAWLDAEARSGASTTTEPDWVSPFSMIDMS